jgi:hypothetical protein
VCFTLCVLCQWVVHWVDLFNQMHFQLTMGLLGHNHRNSKNHCSVKCYYTRSELWCDMTVLIFGLWLHKSMEIRTEGLNRVLERKPTQPSSVSDPTQLLCQCNRAITRTFHADLCINQIPSYLPCLGHISQLPGSSGSVTGGFISHFQASPSDPSHPDLQDRPHSCPLSWQSL